MKEEISNKNMKKIAIFIVSNILSVTIGYSLNYTVNQYKANKNKEIVYCINNIIDDLHDILMCYSKKNDSCNKEFSKIFVNKIHNNDLHLCNMKEIEHLNIVKEIEELETIYSMLSGYTKKSNSRHKFIDDFTNDAYKLCLVIDKRISDYNNKYQIDCYKLNYSIFKL